MKFIIKLVLIALFTLVLASFMPWWSGMLAACLVAIALPGNNFNAFLSGLLGVGLVWMVVAWKIDTETNSILSLKMLEIFPLDDKNMLIILSAFIGGISGALGAFMGNSFRQIFMKKKEKSFYS